MEHYSTQPESEKDSTRLPYNPENDELQGVEEYRDVFNLLDKSMYSVNDRVVHSVVNYASSFINSGR
ncbi:MAG: hypothetical protein ACQESJ_05880 [Bacteroidota bacterium]